MDYKPCLLFGLVLFCLGFNPINIFGQTYTLNLSASGCTGNWKNGNCWIKEDKGYANPTCSTFPPIIEGQPSSSFTSSNDIKIVITENFTFSESFHFDAANVILEILSGKNLTINNIWYLVDGATYFLNKGAGSGIAEMSVWGNIFYNSRSKIYLDQGFQLTATNITISDVAKYNSFELHVGSGSLLRVSNLISFPNSEKNKLIIDGGRAEINEVYLSAGSTLSNDTNQINVLNLGQLTVCSSILLSGNSFLYVDDQYYINPQGDFFSSEVIAQSINLNSDAIFNNDGFVLFEFMSISSKAKINFGFDSVFWFYGDNVDYIGSEYRLNGQLNKKLIDFLSDYYFWDATIIFDDNIGFPELGDWCLNILPIHFNSFYASYKGKDKSIHIGIDVFHGDNNRVEVLRANNKNLNWNSLGPINTEIYEAGNVVLTVIDDQFDANQKIIYYKCQLSNDQGEIIFTSNIIPVLIPDLKEAQYSIFPNPSRDYFQIQGYAQLDNIQIKILDRVGAEVLYLEADNLSNMNLILEEQTSKLIPSIYIMVGYSNGEKLFVKRIQKL